MIYRSNASYLWGVRMTRLLAMGFLKGKLGWFGWFLLIQSWGTGRWLTFLDLLLLLLTAGSKQSENDSGLGVQANGSDHHPPRSLHHMSSWRRSRLSGVSALLSKSVRKLTGCVEMWRNHGQLQGSKAQVEYTAESSVTNSTTERIQTQKRIHPLLGDGLWLITVQVYCKYKIEP